MKTGLIDMLMAKVGFYRGCDLDESWKKALGAMRSAARITKLNADMIADFKEEASAWVERGGVEIVELRRVWKDIEATGAQIAVEGKKAASIAGDFRGMSR